VGIGAYEAKPGWASEDTKALRYLPTTADPVLNLSNFFTIEKDGQYIGFRNAVYSSDMFQTHDNAGYMYVNTYTDKSLDEWSQLAPTYQDGYWLFESGKYPISSGNWACGYLGPWNQIVAIGNISGMVMSTDGDLPAASATTQAARRELTLNCDRVFFNTQRSDATLTITPERTLQQGTFTAVALNVDGLPNKIATFDLNPDGPGTPTA